MGALTTCKDFVSHPHLVETTHLWKDKEGNETKETKLGGCYVCKCAVSAEDINPIADELEALGIRNEIHQTGGFTMCIYIKTGKNSYIYANAEGASSFKDDEDDEGEVLTFYCAVDYCETKDTPEEIAQKIKQVMKEKGLKVKKQ